MTFCLWLTGIPGSGKSTIAKELANDIQYYRYVLNRHYIGNHKELNFAKLIGLDLL